MVQEGKSEGSAETRVAAHVTVNQVAGGLGNNAAEAVVVEIQRCEVVAGGSKRAVRDGAVESILGQVKGLEAG